MLIKNKEVGEFSKLDNKMELCWVEEYFCRGERGIEDGSKEIDLNKIVMVWENNDVAGVVERGSDVNGIEERILWGDGGLNDGDGIESCIDRVEKLLDKESVCIEGEEFIWCGGFKSSEEVEIDFCKWKISLLKS